MPPAGRPNVRLGAPACLHEKAKKVKTPWRLHLGLRLTVHRSTLPAFALDVSHGGLGASWDSVEGRCYPGIEVTGGAFWQASQSPEFGIG
jgi:hypothetical protein